MTNNPVLRECTLGFFYSFPSIIFAIATWALNFKCMSTLSNSALVQKIFKKCKVLQQPIINLIIQIKRDLPAAVFLLHS